MGIDLTDTLVRKNDADFAIADGNDIAGGGAVVQDVAARDALPSSVLKLWMRCVVQDIGGGIAQEQQLTQLSPPVWEEVPSGGGGLPDPATFPDGAVPVVRSGVWIFGTRLTQDDIDAGFSISSFNGAGSYASTKELGDTIVNPSFTAGYSATPASATINDGDGALALTTPFTSFAYSGGNAKTYTKTAIGAAVTWLLTAIGATTKTASRSSTWLPRVFYDAAVPGTLNAAFIAALTGQTLASGFARTIAYGDAGGTKKLYYAFPAAFGTPSLFKDAVTGFGIPFSKVATISVTNGFGVVTSYDLWASDNILTGAFTVVIS